jgi:hypothetical protein
MRLHAVPRKDESDDLKYSNLYMYKEVLLKAVLRAYITASS